jgi:hypothetical protein
MPFAEKMLTEHGEFFPFGAAMKPDGEIVYVGAYDGQERPPSQSLIDLLIGAFREHAVTGKYKATAIVYDVLIIPPGHDRKRDAISVALDHCENYSVVVYFPYDRTAGAVTIHAAFANEGEREIFL